MRKIKTSDISGAAGLRVKKGVLDHLQLSYYETAEATIKNMIGPLYDPTKIYVLYGLLNSTTAPIYTLSAGAVFYAGEIYLVDAVTFTATGADVAVLNIITTYKTGADSDPVQFTDGSNHNVLEIRKMIVLAGPSGSGLKDYTDLDFKPMARNYTEFSSSLTINANLTGATVEGHYYSDGTITFRITATINANIAKGDILVSGLPEGTSGGGVFFCGLLKTATFYSGLVEFVGADIKAAMAFPTATYSTFFFNITYKIS